MANVFFCYFHPLWFACFIISTMCSFADVFACLLVHFVLLCLFISYIFFWRRSVAWIIFRIGSVSFVCFTLLLFLPPQVWHLCTSSSVLDSVNFSGRQHRIHQAHYLSFFSCAVENGGHGCNLKRCFLILFQGIYNRAFCILRGHYFCMFYAVLFISCSSFIALFAFVFSFMIINYDDLYVNDFCSGQSSKQNLLDCASSTLVAIHFELLHVALANSVMECILTKFVFGGGICASVTCIVYILTFLCCATNPNGFQ